MSAHATTTSTSHATVRRPRPTLSRESIAETALRLALEQPTTPLTLARLGAELSADPTALYRHFRNRDELIRALGDHLFGEVAAMIDVTGSWQDALSDVAAAVRQVMLRRPALAADLGVRFTGGPHEREGALVIVDVLRRAGFGESDALRHARAFGEFMLAHVVMAASMLCMAADAQEFEMQVARSLYGPGIAGTPYDYEDEMGRQIVHTYIAGLEVELERQATAASRANMINHERGEL